MKRDVLRSGALVLALSTNVYGSECNIEIRDGSLGQDLTRAFQCIDQRFKTIENKFSDPEQRVGSGTSARSPGAFDAGAFTISVFTASRQGDTLYVGIQVRNKTTEQIFLALNQHDGGLALIDEVTGAPISLYASNIQGIREHRYGHTNDETDYSLIPANAILNFTLPFSSQQAKSDILSLTLHLVSLKNRQVQRISAPLSVTIKGK